MRPPPKRSIYPSLRAGHTTAGTPDTQGIYVRRAMFLGRVSVEGVLGMDKRNLARCYVSAGLQGLGEAVHS